MAADAIIQIDRTNPNGQKVVNAIDHANRFIGILQEIKPLLETAIGTGDGGETVMSYFGVQVAADASDDNGQAFSDIILGFLNAGTNADRGAKLNEIIGKLSAKV